MFRHFLNIVIFFCSLNLFWIEHSAESKIVKKIPVAKGLASHPVNGGRCLISDGTHQYLAFYDGDHQLTVAKRTLGETEWEFAELPEKVGWDTHNKVIIFLDNSGYLHLTGNMHCAPLNYYRTEKPGDIQTFKAIHEWQGKYEERVTYPTLMKLRDGTLLMMYRHGGSGKGMRLLVRYDEETQEWKGTGESFINGMDHEPDCNAYPFGGIREDKNGTLHIAWCWRETPDVVTNYDVCYAKSEDQGLSWKKWDGTPYALPIRPETADVADDIDQKNGLMNGGTMVVDEKGYPYIGYTRFDENGKNQMYVATPVGDDWKVVQLSNFDTRFWFEGRGTIPAYPPIPRLSIDANGVFKVRYSNSRVEPRKGIITFTREQLLNTESGMFEIEPPKEPQMNIPNIRATNIGPLPEGQEHYMQQAVDRPNRDRKPENPREPTMIYIVVTDGKES